MNQIFTKALNRGVPIDTPIMIDIYEFIQLFDTDDLSDDYRRATLDIISKISNIIDMYGGDFILPTHAIISLDEDNSKVLRFSSECLFLSILGLLEGLDFNEVLAIYENKDKYQEFRSQVLNIKSEEELKQKLPRIYDLYIDRQKCNVNFIELENLVNDKNVSLECKLDNVSRMTNNFKECYSNFDLKREQELAKNFSLQAFLERMVKALDNMIINYEEIINIYLSHTLDISNFNPEDADRLNLYIASKFMDEIELAEPQDKQRFLFYLTNYFKDNVETQVTRVKMKIDNKKITPINLYERYKRVLAENPELLAVNFSNNDFQDMNQEEIEEFIVAYLSELAANWELIPSDDTSIEKSVRNAAKRQYRHISEEERKEREAKLLNLYMEKKKFYDQTDPYFRIKGKQTFDGYVGYIYSNSLVILEKFYDNAEDVKIADNQAIYIMSMKDFYDLSQHSKSYLIANHLCKRVIHKRNWQERVSKYINKKSPKDSPTTDTKKLILDNKVIVKEKKI